MIESEKLSEEKPLPLRIPSTPGVSQTEAQFLEAPLLEQLGPLGYLGQLYPYQTKPVHVGPWTLGNGSLAVIAGPCSIESFEQFQTTAQFVQSQGASLLRGGSFKMRTCPEAFQGLGNSALRIAREVSNQLHLPFVSEITDPRQIEDFLETVDMFQVGSRNMYNYGLLRELGRIQRPILLKRGFSATIDEWLHAAEYIVNGGNSQVILCERGIRTFENRMRNTLDLSVVPYLKQNSPFPVIVDPSHGTGVPSLIGPMFLAAIAAGADGVMVEVHPDPNKALSDGFQALTFPHFEAIMKEVRRVAKSLNRRLLISDHQTPFTLNEKQRGAFDQPQV